MTNPPPNNTPETPNSSNPLNRIVQVATHPATLVTGAGLVAVGAVAYIGLQSFVYQQLSPILSAELTKLLKREVKVGEVESFSLNNIRFGNSSIPATSNYPDSLNIKAIDIDFNVLPLLVQRPLQAEITVVAPKLALKEDKQGKWIHLELEEKKGEKPPIDIEASLKLQEADISLLPQGKSKPIAIQVNGQGKYLYLKRGKEKEQVDYDLDVNLLQSAVNVKGNTVLDTGKTKAELLVEKLALPELVALIPNSPLQLNKGQFAADLNLNLPSFKDIKETQGKGDLSLTGLEGKIKPLKAPLKAKAIISLQGSKIIVEQAEASLGEIVTQMGGNFDWQSGFNLKVDVKPFRLANLMKTLSVSLPVKVEGKMQANLNLKGKLTNPRLTGTIRNQNLLQVDKIQIKEISSNFQGDLDKFVLKSLQIKPTAGGKIVASGQLKMGVGRSRSKKEKIDWQKMPLSFNLKGELPTQELIANYYNLPPGTKLETLTMQGQIKGNLKSPQASFKWQLPNSSVPSISQVSGGGEVLLVNKNILIRNTELKTNTGKVSLTGIGNLDRKNWQAYLMANSLALNPFVAQACQNSSFKCPADIINKPLNLEKANVRLTGNFRQLNMNNIQAVADVGVQVDRGMIAIKSQLNAGQINAFVTATQIPLNSFITNVSVPVNLSRSQISLSGSINQLFNNSQLNLNTLQAKTETQLTVANRPVQIRGQLDSGLLTTSITANQIPLNPFLPQLSANVSLSRSQINLSAPIEQLFANSKLNLKPVQATTEVDLNIANSPLKIRGGLQEGILIATANTNQLALNQLIPNLPIPARLIKSQLNLSANLDNLLTSLNTNPDFSSFKLTAGMELAVAQGKVEAVSQLNQNQWQTNLVAANINPAVICRNFKLSCPSLTDKVNGQLNISSLIPNPQSPIQTWQELAQISLPIQINQVALRADGQTLQGKGNLLLTNLTTKPDISSLNLDLQARSHLDNLPLTQLLTLAPIKRELLPETLQLTGQAQFQGKLRGKNLLQSPTSPGSLQLAGNLKLLNFSFNEQKFAPILAGPIQASLGQAISLNLKGNGDVIAAAIEPCNLSSCLAPYLPTSFEFRQTSSKSPIFARGKRQGERLIAQIDNFPLQWLKIAPAKQYGDPAVVSGNVKASVDVNLVTATGSGSLDIQQPSLGRISAQSFSARLAYDKQIARLQAASLQLGKSRYEVQGALNFQSGAVEGKLEVAQGYVEDILTALQVSNLDTILSLAQFKKPEYATAAAVQPQPVGKADASIAYQVNLLAEIDRKIREFAKNLQKAGMPSELDIEGAFNAQIALAGTLKNPQVDFQLQGQDWQWNPQSSFPNIVKPLGLVVEETQVIPIKAVQVKGSLQDGAIAIQPAQVQLQDANLSFSGSLLPSPTCQKCPYQIAKAQVQVENLSLDQIRPFVPIPLDISGNINARATLAGSTTQPIVEGRWSFTEGALNARLLETNIAGDFGYRRQRLEFRATEPESIQIFASVPYPTQPKSNDEVKLNIKLDTKAIALIGVLSQGQLEWVDGKGEATLNATGRLDLSDQVRINNLNVQGLVSLDNATLKSPVLPEVLRVNGEIALDNQRLKVEQLKGTFAQSKLSVNGVLPLFLPISSRDPDAANPLTVTIEKGKMQIANLYQGGIDAQVVLTGAAINPVIGGEVKLENGEISLANQNPQVVAGAGAGSSVFQKWRRTLVPQGTPVGIPRLENFQIVLDGLDITYSQYLAIVQTRFNLGGNLKLNGTLDSLDNLQPDGIIRVNDGELGVFNAQIFVNRSYENYLKFTPLQGLFDPNVNLQLRAYLPQIQFVNIQGNEIPTDAYSFGKPQSVEVTITIQGKAAQLVPALAKDASQICEFRPEDLPPIPESPSLTTESLQKVSDCVALNALASESAKNLIESRAVTVSSNPPLTSNQIVALFGQQASKFAYELQQQNSLQLSQFGFPQLGGIAFPFITKVPFEVNQATSNVGGSIGLPNLKVYPQVESTYEIGTNSRLRLSYDYNFNQVRLRYETSF